MAKYLYTVPANMKVEHLSESGATVVSEPVLAIGYDDGAGNAVIALTAKALVADPALRITYEVDGSSSDPRVYDGGTSYANGATWAAAVP